MKLSLKGAFSLTNTVICKFETYQEKQIEGRIRSNGQNLQGDRFWFTGITDCKKYYWVRFTRDLRIAQGEMFGFTSNLDILMFKYFRLCQNQPQPLEQYSTFI